jgi:hypothetical protein
VIFTDEHWGTTASPRWCDEVDQGPPLCDDRLTATTGHVSLHRQRRRSAIGEAHALVILHGQKSATTRFTVCSSTAIVGIAPLQLRREFREYGRTLGPRAIRTEPWTPGQFEPAAAVLRGRGCSLPPATWRNRCRPPGARDSVVAREAPPATLLTARGCEGRSMRRPHRR